MICRLTPKSCVMYAGLRLAKTFVCCCPDQLNKRLADSKIESVRRKLCSVHAKSTFVVASSQSQRVAFMTRSATVTFAINNYGGLVDRRMRGGADRYVAGNFGGVSCRNLTNSSRSPLRRLCTKTRVSPQLVMLAYLRRRY